MRGDESTPDPIITDVAWQTLVTRGRPWWRQLSTQILAQAEVRTPGGVYWVRVVRNNKLKPVIGDPIDNAIENIRLMGRTGWSVRVLTPPTPFSASRELFRQNVYARAIVPDIALVIVEALRRGDRLWDED